MFQTATIFDKSAHQPLRLPNLTNKAYLINNKSKNNRQGAKSTLKKLLSPRNNINKPRFSRSIIEHDLNSSMGPASPKRGNNSSSKKGVQDGDRSNKSVTNGQMDGSSEGS